jgi:sulfur carrier protein
MRLVLNGESREVAATTVAGLLEELGMSGQAVAVEVNHRVVPRRQHADTPLNDGDTVELVTLVGGG